MATAKKPTAKKPPVKKPTMKDMEKIVQQVRTI